MNTNDPTQRFSSRADNYARYRPGYPPEALACLRDECGLTPAWVVADVGSGTGILTRLFLDNGNRVYAVEPNAAMRHEAERDLADYVGFVSVNGRAEATALPDNCVELVAAGQAFHWFDAAASRIEFRRILRPGGYVALVWNARAYEGDPLMAAYERVLEAHGMGYHVVTHRSHAGELEALFTKGHTFRAFSHARLIDFAALWGGFCSASYAPLPDDPRYEPMRAALRDVFNAYQRDGQVAFRYDTHLFYGQLS
jgi:ubiquinone/menaquinone biosynthesis C-methylase UbiE